MAGCKREELRHVRRRDLAPQDVRMSSRSQRSVVAPNWSSNPVSCGAVLADVRMSTAQRRRACAGVRTRARAGTCTPSGVNENLKDIRTDGLGSGELRRRQAAAELQLPRRVPAGGGRGRDGSLQALCRPWHRTKTAAARLGEDGGVSNFRPLQMGPSGSANFCARGYRGRGVPIASFSAIANVNQWAPRGAATK